MAASSSEKPQDKLHRLKENGMFWGHTVTLHRVGSLQSFPRVSLCIAPGLACLALSCSLALLCSHGYNRILSRNCSHADNWILSRRGRT